MAQLETTASWSDYPVPMVDQPQETQRLGAGFIQIFILLVFVCQVCLLTPSLSPLRVVFRSLSFGTSLLFLVVIPGSGPKHPAAKWLWAVPAILILEFLHPDTATYIAALATTGLYLAILAPVFWVSRLRITPSGFRRIILTLWAFNVASAGVGVLQVYYPGHFASNVSSVMKNETGLGGLMITLADGSQIYRPMGLTDTPGGAANAGMMAAVMAMGLFLNEKRTWLKAVFVGSIFIGFFCLYICQVRSVLVMTGVALFTFMFVLARRGEFNRAISALFVFAVAVLGAFFWAFAHAGSTVTDRLMTLINGNPLQVYSHNRGGFVIDTIVRAIPTYPLGAGLGRWGMMWMYFGRSSPLPPEWSEIIWTGWVYDGGIVMLFVYAVALLIALYIAWKLATDRSQGSLGIWAALVFAYDIGAVALTFDCNLFVAQGGMEFWLLNGSLFAAYIYAMNHPPAELEAAP